MQTRIGTEIVPDREIIPNSAMRVTRFLARLTRFLAPQRPGARAYHLRAMLMRRLPLYAPLSAEYGGAGDVIAP